MQFTPSPSPGTPSQTTNTSNTLPEDTAVRLLTAQTGWLPTTDREKFSEWKNAAVASGQDQALIRDVTGTQGNTKSPFTERKIQFISAQNAQIVDAFLKEHPDFSKQLLSDPVALIGDYPHTKPVDGVVTGWIPESITFTLVSLTKAR